MSCIENTPSPPQENSPPTDRKASTRIIATVLPFSGQPSSEDQDDDLMNVQSPFRKMFRESDTMQESGIYFEDEDLGKVIVGTMCSKEDI